MSREVAVYEGSKDEGDPVYTIQLQDSKGRNGQILKRNPEGDAQILQASFSTSIPNRFLPKLRRYERKVESGVDIPTMLMFMVRSIDFMLQH